MKKSKYRILVVAQNKGGVGKTFLSKCLAEYVSIVRKQRVLLIDLDPQTNLSRRFLDMELIDDGSDSYSPPLHPDYDPIEDPDWNGFSDASDIWLHGFAVPYPTKFENLEIIPSHAQKLEKIELVRQQEVYDEVVTWLKKFLLLDEMKEDYDIVIIDTRPSKGPLVQASMYAATHLLIPSEMEAPSVEGLHGMLSVRNQANLSRDKTDQLSLIGILANKYQTKASLHQEYYSALAEDERIGQCMLNTKISDWLGYKNSMLYGAESLFNKKKTNKYRKQIESACEEIISKLYE